MNLRLYSVYGPMEDSSRLIPNIVHFGASGLYPELVDPRVSRDFIYVDDVARAFIDVGFKLTEPDYGESFNLGTGRKTTIGDIVSVLSAYLISAAIRCSLCPTGSGT